MKRAKSEWGTSIQEIMAKRPYGSGVKTHNIDNNTALVHFTFSRDTPAEEIDRFAKHIKPLLPSNAIAVFTVEGIKIEVDRPPPVRGKLTMNFMDTIIQGEDQVRELTALMDRLTKEGVEATVTFQGCDVRRSLVISQPANFVVTKIPEATLGRPIQPDVDELTVENIDDVPPILYSKKEE